MILSNHILKSKNFRCDRITFFVDHIELRTFNFQWYGRNCLYIMWLGAGQWREPFQTFSIIYSCPSASLSIQTFRIGYRKVYI
jgi:hypothetical protein